MSLNNISSEVIARYTESYLNCSAWGLTLSQTREYLEILLPLYNPDLVIIGLGPGQLNESPAALRLDWRFRAYLRGVKTVLPLFYNHIDTIVKRRAGISGLRENRYQYASLLYDEFGGVPLPRNGFPIDQSRWNEPVATVQSSSAYEEIACIAAVAEKYGVKDLCIAQTPVRTDAMSLDEKMEFDLYIARMAESCRESGVFFVDLQDVCGRNERLFVDSAHLSEEGAVVSTEILMSSLRDRITFKMLQ
jgi:hypothetical protein